MFLSSPVLHPQIPTLNQISEVRAEDESPPLMAGSGQPLSTTRGTIQGAATSEGVWRSPSQAKGDRQGGKRPQEHNARGTNRPGGAIKGMPGSGRNSGPPSVSHGKV
jgi:hypothetical protein